MNLFIPFVVYSPLHFRYNQQVYIIPKKKVDTNGTYRVYLLLRELEASRDGIQEQYWLVEIGV